MKVLGVEPRFETLPADTGPVAYVVSLNVKRRNLTRDQRAIAAAAAEAWPMYEGRRGKPARSVQVSGNTRDLLATMFSVGVNAIQEARYLLAEEPTAAEAVKTGKVG